MSFHVFIVILHVLGAAVLFGVVFFSLVFALKKNEPQNLKFVSLLRPFGMYAAAWQFITGVLLAYPEWDEFSHSKVFWTKMALYVVDGIIAERIIRHKLNQNNAGGSQTVDITLWAWISVLVIATIIGLGVLLAEH